MLVVILPVLQKSASFPLRSGSSRTFFVSVSIPMFFRLPGVRGTRIRVGTAVIFSLRARSGLFEQIDHGYPVFSWGVRFADLLYVRVRGETPGCPVRDIEPQIDKILLFSP
jgi:hypothetical protein